MPILAFLVTVAAGAAVWWWRLKLMREAGGEIIDSVQKMRGAFRRKKFRMAAETAPLASIRDPAIAAVAYFLCLAHEKPQSLAEANTYIRQRMAGIIAEGDMDEVLVFAEWAARRVINPTDPVRRFRDLWRERLTFAECRDLFGMAEDVVALCGPPTPDQSASIEALRLAILT
ncbi:hypothetical protein [Allorhizobium taibaishanense]|uniref:Co-chaperone DjlA N-terminal domain-containing protein n=1 Tax=Allorhizobium taibaishanense TaxID=887144 RepID=A0A1Q9A4J4_9HYPH|nr:hypothetical protein [Allorhizobium taibaishanense]MBB4006533.1 hypothetical protein [Allorhizobium taibaishanense]OLP49462.1 hypothetical protein BJF91_20730 [Allorhizobium taibaishanense]